MRIKLLTNGCLVEFRLLDDPYTEPKLSVIAAIQPGGSKLIIGNSQQPRSVLGERACQVVYQMPLTGSGANLRTVAR